VGQNSTQEVPRPELAASSTAQATVTSSPDPDIPVTEAPAIAPTLKPPDAEGPTAGICQGPPEGELVVITIRPDVPEPRCIQAYRHQRLVMINGTDVEVQARLAGFEVTLQSGEEGTFDKALGEYLQPGAHFLQTTSPGTGGELILLDQ